MAQRGGADIEMPPYLQELISELRQHPLEAYATPLRPESPQGEEAGSQAVLAAVALQTPGSAAEPLRLPLEGAGLKAPHEGGGASGLARRRPARKALHHQAAEADKPAQPQHCLTAFRRTFGQKFQRESADDATSKAGLMGEWSQRALKQFLRDAQHGAAYTGRGKFCGFVKSTRVKERKRGTYIYYDSTTEHAFRVADDYVEKALSMGAAGGEDWLAKTKDEWTDITEDFQDLAWEVGAAVSQLDAGIRRYYDVTRYHVLSDAAASVSLLWSGLDKHSVECVPAAKLVDMEVLKKGRRVCVEPSWPLLSFPLGAKTAREGKLSEGGSGNPTPRAAELDSVRGVFGKQTGSPKRRLIGCSLPATESIAAALARAPAMQADLALLRRAGLR